MNSGDPIPWSLQARLVDCGSAVVLAGCPTGRWGALLVRSASVCVCAHTWLQHRNSRQRALTCITWLCTWLGVSLW